MVAAKLSELTWEEVRDLDHDKTVAIFPIGAIEAHGPHLPLATDVHISEAMASSAATKLEAAGLVPVMLPCLPFSSADFAAEFPGTLSVSPQTVTELIVGVGRSLSAHRFSMLLLLSAHLDPTHLSSIHAAVSACEEADLLPVVFPDITRKPWALRMSDEFKSGACHAGQYETSVVMATRPDLVREELRQSLEPNMESLSTAIRAGLRTFQEANGPRAYFGSPQAASQAEGEQTIELLGEIAAEGRARCALILLFHSRPRMPSVAQLLTTSRWLRRRAGTATICGCRSRGSHQLL